MTIKEGDLRIFNSYHPYLKGQVFVVVKINQTKGFTLFYLLFEDKIQTWYYGIDIIISDAISILE
jgi:hypothetical protein